ncbi:MAG: UDP-N-acetylmuramate--L-alanine ligase [Elusimicrobia bacterium CG08_land_8_20_14_0_20_59_10]|nr:MAG: UDP-N-acetylmuramate--L-alanine ligase [Elusimicrobia bacterium CG08_land_8_20_14_0_20_59_10]
MDHTSDFTLESVRKVHFIGIGGIGMSGIARLMLAAGFGVSGSDSSTSELTSCLKKEGARVHLGHAASNLGGADIVVVSSAVRPDNPELRAALSRGVKVVRRARMLSKIAELKKTITVAGSHGKTTTTSMISSALLCAGADATTVVGGIFKNIGSNVSLGKSEYFVMEADESDGSFLDYSPLVACVTNIDSDHLDHYGNMARLKEAFLLHLARVPFYGRAVLCSDDPVLSSVLGGVKCPYETYGLAGRPDWTAADIKGLPGGGSSYTAFFRGSRKGHVRLHAPGRHNLLNSLCALAAGSYLGFDFAGLAAGIEDFKGVKRRMERLGGAAGVEFLDDYGHHPTEIKAAIAAARELFSGRRLKVVFQPHRYTRTKILLKDFARAFPGADRVYLMDIYPAGEKPIPGVSSARLLAELRRSGLKAEAFPGSLELSKELRSGDVLLTVGAGDVWKTGEEIKLRRELFS